ncbi:MAG TPA: M48 family metalloprotease [Xanthobacteraceae bacterium]|nr:M48 family metalloprotease [Xanthobacteraceae bacterium]
MAEAYGLYTHIRTNRVRSAFMFAGLFLLVYVMVFAGALVARAFLTPDASLDWYLRQAWTDLIVAAPFATAGAALWVFVAYHFHQTLIDFLTRGHEITRTEQPRLYNLLENLCISRGIPMPKLKIVEAAELNAFATGLNQKQYAISVTRGLVERLDDAEIEAVLAHELTHIRNGDVRMLVVALVIAGIIGFFAEMTFRMMFHARGSARPSTWSSRRSSSGDRKGGGGAVIAILIAVMLIAVAWFLSQVIRFALSRSREYLADAGAVELTKNPDAMVMALRKIEGRGELPDAPSAVMEMCLDNPRSGFVDLFATHPSIEDRVDALVRLAGGRDPGPIAIAGEETEAIEDQTAPADAESAGEPFLPDRPPLAIGPAGHPFLVDRPPLPGGEPSGPWGSPAREAEPPHPSPWEPNRRGS